MHHHHLEASAQQTTSSFGVRIFPGGHFYLNHAPDVLAALEDDSR